MERTWEPPDKGPWELESTHFSRPVTRFAQSAYSTGFVRGFSEGTARYGLLLDHLEPGLVNGFMYMQPVAFGAPKGAMGPPPKPILWLITRAHPGMRKRIATSARAFADRQWRADLKMWDEIDRPAAVAKHREIQDISVESLTDAELADHLLACHDHLTEMHYLHHKYTITMIAATGDFIASAAEWTGVSAGELIGLLRGSSDISKGFAASELDRAAKSIVASEGARAVLGSTASPADLLTSLRADAGAGADVAAYVEAVQFRSVGYDVGDRNAGEMPQILIEALRGAVAGSSAPTGAGDQLAQIRARVPAAHEADFDDRLAEARLVNRLRDERGVYSDGWATGLARRALLEAGRRLVSTGLLSDAEHVVDLEADECAALLRGQPGPAVEDVAERYGWRTTHTTDDAPPFLRAMPAPPPAVDVLPPAARRAARAADAVLHNLFGVPDTPNTDDVLHGLAVNTGSYEGTARLVDDSADFERIQQGDVLVTRMTSPYFNVVLPLLGAIVTDRGGQLCHAAIVAREYGIPGIVGTREATKKIRDGARVRVDGSSGEVRLLG
ncbi:PEP-utilizing enzyme [Aeromicrobium sp.]|uniref:PEP-utilizing enzyme n=1 Tax=Aeromicrobium sp. TaxID=1871063 RepID=UPI003C6112D8